LSRRRAAAFASAAFLPEHLPQRNGKDFMGYHDREDSPPREAETPAPTPMAQIALSAFVRLVGVAVLLVGLWAGIKIVLEAWALYEDPQRIERFADAIQHGSNIDGLIGTLAASGEEAAGERARDEKGEGGLRLSYFAAWFVVLLLMFVIGSLAMAAITTGGQLALYDLQVRQHSRAVIREVRRLRRVA
jgi:hypothetical protein